MLPPVLKSWNFFRPKTEKEKKDDLDFYLKNGLTEKYYNSTITNYDDAVKVLKALGVKSNSPFYEFYSTYKGIAGSTNIEADDSLYALDEIVEDYKNPFWGEKYPNITDRYLRISSIEGEGSYFYDKETDAVYDVDWAEMDDFIAGKLKPLFTSFYDFLEWYYSEDD